MKLQKNQILIQQVYLAINKWNINSKIADFEHISMFRYKLKKLSPIPFSFIENCIKLIMFEKFDWAFKQNVAMQKYRLDFEIKQKYQQLCFKEGFNKDFKFYFLMVIIVKACCYFVQNNVNDIRIDDTFQGEVFIILMHIVLGLKIGTKSFKEVFQKYRSKQKRILYSQKKDSSSNSFSKISKAQLAKQPKQYTSKLKINLVSSKNNIQKSKKNSKRRRVLSNNSRDARFSLLSKISFTQDEGYQFAKQIKNNLYVKPLPPPVKKRLTVRQLDAYNQNPYNHDYRRMLPNIQRKMRTIAIASDQLSDSFKYIVSYRGQQSAKLNSSFKINCKPQQNSLYYQLPKIRQNKQKQLPLSKKQKKRAGVLRNAKQKDANQWKQVVNELKSSRLENQNLKSNTNIRDFTNLDAQKENIANFIQIDEQIIDAKCIKLDTFRDNLQPLPKKILNEQQIDQNISDMSRIDKKIPTINPLQILTKKSSKKRVQLIKSYKSFVNKCTERQQKIFGRIKQYL